MDDKMKSAFDAWGVERSKKIATLGIPTSYEYAQWALDYIKHEWKPIETAPKDGTSVLVLIGSCGMAHVARFVDSGWEIAWDGYSLSWFDGPVKWMPLPAVPAPKESK